MLKSILERTLDQIINNMNTATKADQRNREKKFSLKNSARVEKDFISMPLPDSALFLKQNCATVSRISVDISKRRIFGVSLFLDILA